MSRYLYIDDASPEDLATFTDTLCGAAASLGLTLVIDIERPPPDLRMEDMLLRLKPDGLLIDVELEKAVDVLNRPYPVTGTAIAQNVRDIQNAEKIPELPLIRLSQRDIIRKYVGKDHTSLDLFDQYFDKAAIRTFATEYAEKLVALDAGYVELKRTKPLTLSAIAGLLGTDADRLERLNASLLFQLEGMNGAPAHEFARFVSRGLIDRDGPLIGEATLAARLGIDAAASGNAWSALAKSFSPALYRGIFAVRTAPRWWADQVADLWSDNDPERRLLVNTTANERRDVLAQIPALDGLQPIAESAESPGPYYWTTCVESGRPLDPMHGYAVTADWIQREWHDMRYMCRGEAFHRARDVRFDHAERARILEDRD